MNSKKHDWATFQRYMNAHDRVLKTYAKFMDRPREYIQEEVTDNFIQLRCFGILFTTYNGNKVRVDILKDVEIDDSNPKRFLARTQAYNYNANRPGVGNLIRYDSPDSFEMMEPHAPPHHFFHHKHDYTSGVEKITQVDDDEWPHVHEFFDEVLSRF